MKKYISIKKYFKLQEKKELQNRKFWYIFLILLLIIFIFSLYKVFNWSLDNLRLKKLNNEIEKNVNLNIIDDNESEFINPPSDKNSNYYYYVTFPLHHIDFSSLLNKNKETIGYISIKNTIVNYPVVQTNNNEYYLNHSFDNKRNTAGWIFMDYRNNINVLSDNTILYGHSRIDGTMFGSLRNTLLSSWQKDKDNYVIYFSTLKEDMIFLIFSIYTINSESYYMIPNFNDNSEKQKWIETVKKRNMTIINTEVNVKDKILTLSTCYNTKGGRIVIHAKLIKSKYNKNI